LMKCVRVVVGVRVGRARVIALIRVTKLVPTAPSKQRDRLVLYVTPKINVDQRTPNHRSNTPHTVV
jgi:hypothetical protein